MKVSMLRMTLQQRPPRSQLVKKLPRQRAKKKVRELQVVRIAVNAEIEVEEAEEATEVAVATEIEEIMKVAEEEAVAKVEKVVMASSTRTRDQELLKHQRTTRIATSSTLVRRLITSAVEEATTECDEAVVDGTETEAASEEIEAAKVAPKAPEALEEVREEASVEVTSQLPITTVTPRVTTVPLLLNESCANNFSCFYLLQ